MKTVIGFLENLQRRDLVLLLRSCRYEASEQQVDDGWYRDLVTVVTIEAPPPIAEALLKLPDYERKRLAQAVASAESSLSAPNDITVVPVDNDEVSPAAQLLADLLIHREMMISVATGGDRIQDVNDFYCARESRIRSLLPDDVRYENPHGDDLWHWYEHWGENFPHYRERRHYIRELFGQAIEAIAGKASLPNSKREPTGWGRVDRTVSKARNQLELAAAEEDYQAIGLLCREAIISLAQAVFDPTIHESLDGVKPSPTDANRMIDAFVAHAGTRAE